MNQATTQARLLICNDYKLFRRYTRLRAEGKLDKLLIELPKDVWIQNYLRRDYLSTSDVDWPHILESKLGWGQGKKLYV